jgi:uncharacterized membrane protein YfcA
MNVLGISVSPILCRWPAHGSLAAAIVPAGKAYIILNCAVFSVILYLAPDHVILGIFLKCTAEQVLSAFYIQTFVSRVERRDLKFLCNP